MTEVASKLGLEELLERKPSELSGGQRQRVAMGRAIVREPKAFLMDEPLSNLDAKLRVTMRAELARLHERLGVTTVYVTHDQVEAMTLGQRVAVLRDGVLQQVDTPQRLFHEPANLFVAAFIGSPSMNLVEADVVDGSVRFAGYELTLPQGSSLGPVASSSAFARPTSRTASPRSRASRACASGRRSSRTSGSESHVIFTIDAPRVVAEDVRAAEDLAEPGESLLADDTRAVFTARLDGERFIAHGAEVELALDPQRMYFFDPATGDVLGRDR